jgi:electron transfer flavoprotein beta subunit
MKVLICISHVPDTTTRIKFTGDGSELDKAGVTYIINPYDEYGLSKALDFREAGVKVDSITALCVGGPETEATLIKALSIGADDAVRIDANPVDAQYVAAQIAGFAREREYDLILAGKESIDYNGGLVPGLVAELMSMPFVSFATHMEMTASGSALLHREVDGGHEVIESNLPLVVSCQKGLAEWRIPNMRGIMAARKKPLSVVKPTSNESFSTTKKFSYPPAKSSCQFFKPGEEEQLVAALTGKGII